MPFLGHRIYNGKDYLKMSAICKTCFYRKVGVSHLQTVLDSIVCLFVL